MEEFIEVFTQYGADIAVLAVICSVLVQICKQTFLKDVPKKVLTFAPFIIGVVLYAVYADVKNLSFLYAFTEFHEILEQGFAVGTLATLLYVLYEQFVRGDGTDGNESSDGEDGASGAADAGELFSDNQTEETDTAFCIE